MMSLALCPQVVSQVPQHFRSSEKQATCDDCFARQSICSVISLHCGMSRHNASFPSNKDEELLKDHLPESSSPWVKNLILILLFFFFFFFLIIIYGWQRVFTRTVDSVFISKSSLISLLSPRLKLVCTNCASHEGHFNVVLVLLLVPVCCDTAQTLVLSVCCDKTQALVLLLVSVCCVTAQALVL